MTEFEKWLKDNKVAMKPPPFGGYEFYDRELLHKCW